MDVIVIPEQPFLHLALEVLEIKGKESKKERR